MAKQIESVDRRWYAIHTYSGYENAVLKNLKQRIESLGMENKIFNVIVPIEKKIKVKNGKRVEVEEKVYPGYVLVEMTVDDNSWYVVRNTPRVTGFVGAGTIPVPLSEAEVNFFLNKPANDSPEHDMSVTIGEIIRISDGPFKDFEGKVNEIDKARGKLKVLVNMFGRETSVELDFLQIKKM